MRSWFLLLSVLVLATACSSSGVTLSQQEVNTAYSAGEFAYAGAGRDLRVVVAGNPFGGDQAAFASAVTDAMQGQHWGQKTHFTTTPGENAREIYRVVMLFNPPNTLNARRLCREDGSSLPVSATNDGIVLFGAFCRGDNGLTSIKGRAPGTGNVQDPAFRSLVAQVTNGLFPPKRDRLRDDRRCPPLMGCN